MLRIPSFQAGLPVFKALASETRVQLMDLLMQEGPMSMGAIAERMGIAAGSLTPHVRILQECGLLQVTTASGRHGALKMCSLATESLLLAPNAQAETSNVVEAEIGVGQYTSYEVRPTCGISTTEQIIGQLDDPEAFAELERASARILWFSSGYVEYMLPCFLKEGQAPLELQLSMEISSEAPGFQEDWPSEIEFFLNGVSLGCWTSPGDFGRTCGIYNPPWWHRNWNQHGLLKLLSVNAEGCFIDGGRISGTRIADVRIRPGRAIAFRIATSRNAGKAGGVTLFGRGFGNYPQDIRMRMRHRGAAEE